MKRSLMKLFLAAGDLVEGSPFRYLDAGSLANARFVERMTLFIAELGRCYDYFPRMNWRLLGTRWTPGQADTFSPLMARAVSDP